MGTKSMRVIEAMRPRYVTLRSPPVRSRSTTPGRRYVNRRMAPAPARAPQCALLNAAGCRRPGGEIRARRIDRWHSRHVLRALHAIGRIQTTEQAIDALAIG